MLYLVPTKFEAKRTCGTGYGPDTTATHVYRNPISVILPPQRDENSNCSNDQFMG